MADPPFIAGGIHRKRQFWMSLNIQFGRMITAGYDIPFILLPSPAIRTNNCKSAYQHESFVDDEIKNLLATGAIEIAEHGTVRINPLSVHPGKKLRLILDLSELNNFVAKEKIKFEDLSSVRYLLPKNGFMASFDLKSAYHSVLISQNSRNFLGFEWRGNQYKFRALPFGLSSAPLVFTKLLRPLLKSWRQRGIGIAMYLDDGIIWAPDYFACCAAVETVRNEITAAGFTFALEKCRFEPSQQCTWLGFDIDLASHQFSVSENRRNKALEAIQNIVAKPNPSLLERMKFTGCVASMHLIFPAKSKRISKRIMIEIADAEIRGLALFRKFPLNIKTHENLAVWHSTLLSRTWADLIDIPDTFQPSHEIYVDASELAVGAVLTGSAGSVPSNRELPPSLVGESSTARELFAIWFGISTFVNSLSGPTIVFCDNQSAVAIWLKGSMKIGLHELAERIWALEKFFNLDIRVAWIPRESNTEADTASRIIDPDDWRISQRIAKEVQCNLMNCSIDLFANDRNAKCPNFVSKWRCPGAFTNKALHPRAKWFGNRSYRVEEQSVSE